jgi:predicted transposase YbfD/YdcC
LELLVIALAAVLCGAESCSDMADFGQANEGLLRLFLRLEHGIPSHDTFSRMFRLLDPEGFETAFRRFMAAFAKANGLKLTGVVAIDGKALRSAFERGQRSTPLHLVNVWAVQARIAVAQQKAPARNETAGALEVLQLLSLEGCIVTADALHCHRAMAATILDRWRRLRAGNQSQPGATVRGGGAAVCSVGQAQCRRAARTIHARPARSAARDNMRNTSLAAVHGFPGVAAIGRVTSRRRLHGQRAEPPLIRYYLLSKYMSAARLLQVTRSHWSIENQLHWVLDVHFDEDGNRARKDNAPENLAILRRLALNILRSHPDRTSIRRKIKRAGWDDAFLMAILSHMR